LSVSWGKDGEKDTDVLGMCAFLARIKALGPIERVERDNFKF